MLDARIALALVASIGLAAPAFAQQTGKTLDDLDATRINPNQITIDFDYDGSACEQVGPAEIGDLFDGTLAVTFPTISTAEVCTQQIQEIEVEQTIQAENIISRIDVTLTAPDGSVIATGTTDVDHD
ncbi:hypothetical protein [Devosia sp. Leaf64]|jgi:hypothetical protein|uniref:hypothetical protein n=1 Tax=Devosia sp. Leaf64 TaxID=1736229 RepID=UPI000715A520|nr:hypothetical protein [Devosia sp. Leaf64]KQN72463.1 hypothetical protein ASE94_08105 [Devosia sp. Leaf64]